MLYKIIQHLSFHYNDSLNRLTTRKVRVTF